MANKLYKEQQRFTDKPTLLLLTVGTIASVYGIVTSVMAGSAWTETLIYTFIAAGLIGLLRFVLRLRLEVVVSDKQIKYKLNPVHNSPRKIKWKDVKSCKIVKTPLLAPNHGTKHHFGGVKRVGFFGRNGLSITTKDGENYFIGVKNVDNLKEALGDLSLG